MRLFRYIELFLFFSFFPLLVYSSDKKLSMLPSYSSTKLLCTIHGKSFIDNREYFNKIMEGETIFGFHFWPSLTFLISEEIGLNLGIIWERHFGHMKPWNGIRPSYCVYYNQIKATFVVGIFTDPSVVLLEPLYVVRKPFVEGFYFKLVNNKVYLSGCLNWITLLSKKDNQPETFTLRLYGTFQQNHSNKTVDCTIPFQLVVYHLGGQGIMIKDYSIWCGASGITLHFLNSFGNQCRWMSYLLFNRYIKEIDRPCKEGWGQLHTIDWRTSLLGLSLSYWYGNNFSSENMGHRLYQSMCIEDNKVVCYESIRNLLFLSIYKDWILNPSIIIQAIFRPYYDFKNRLLEYDFSCKLVYTYTVPLHYSKWTEVDIYIQ